MRRRVKRILGILLLLGALGFAVLNLLAFNHARTMMIFVPAGERTVKPEELSVGEKMHVLFTGVTVPRPASDSPPSVLDPSAESLSISVSEDVVLSAWLCGAAADNPLVILCHGYAAGKTDQVREAKAFLELGCGVLLLDFRGSGGSSENYTSLGYHEAEDVKAAVDFAKTGIPHSRLVLFGQSMGAVAILRAIHALEVKPDAVIAESIFDRMTTTVRNRFRAMGVPSFPSAELLVFWGGRQQGFNAFRHNPVDYAASVTCPILFLHGEHDPRSLLSDARKVFKRIPAGAHLMVFNGASHQSLVLKEGLAWRKTVSDFLITLGEGSQSSP